MDRASFLRLSAAGAVTLGAGSVRAATPTATPVGDDESFVAFGAVAEGVGAAVYLRALLAKHTFDRHERELLRAAHAAKRAHAATLQAVLGDNADSAADFVEAFPKGSLRSRRSLLRLAERLERLAVGVYLSGVAYAADQNTRALLGETLSADVRQIAVVRMLRGLPPLDGKLAPVDIELAGNVLDRYLRSPDAPDEGDLG
jgi:Ferritin-like domain